MMVSDNINKKCNKFCIVCFIEKSCVLLSLNSLQSFILRAFCASLDNCTLDDIVDIITFDSALISPAMEYYE
jgi:hypothetical protein